MEEKQKDIIDRNLGDEWSEWSGNLEEYEKTIEEGKALFLIIYFAALFVLTVFSMFLYYLIAPRLYEIHPYLDQAVLWLVIIIFGSIFIWSLFLLLSIALNRNFLFLRKKSGLHIELLYPVIYKIAGMFKISKDRIGNSLIKVNNAVIYATKKKFRSENLLVLLPRCLSKEIRIKVMEITEKYKCPVFTATGGSSARKMVVKNRPDAIIGVACERDLVAGMADSPHKIPVIAIANTRPEGPCKNTFIDTDELEKAVKFLLKI